MDNAVHFSEMNEDAASRPPSDGADTADDAVRHMEAGEKHAEMSADVSLVSTQRGTRPSALHLETRIMRHYSSSSLAVALAVLALGFVAMQGARRTALESEGMKEYSLAQAKAVFASDEVEVRNSKRRLNLIKNKLAGEKESAQQRSRDEKGLSKVLLNKAEDYELQADISAARVAKLQLKDRKVPKVAKQEAAVSEEDDKFFAHALQRAAQRSSDTAHHVQHVHLFLQQYGTTTQLKVGELREDRYLEAALERMQVDGQNVEVLLAAQKRNAANPATKVDADEQEAMAIENLAKLG
mmetsp:Transcript_91120/g.147222  ORF Transcript_91120/g.147222 Transcript_91120/m.147222 type:complete len:297 (+) Transcript_91120:2-892(+)